MDEIKKQANSYIKLGLAEICAIHSTIVILRMAVGFDFQTTLHANLIATLYALVIVAAAGMLWNKVARKPDYIPSFHMGVSTVRLLLALAVIFIYIMNIDTEAPLYDPQTKVIFLAVFAVYYIQLLVHHYLFHSRLNHRSETEGKSNKKNDNENN